MPTDTPSWTLACVECADSYDEHELRYRCDCGGTLDVVLDPTYAPRDPRFMTEHRGDADPLSRSGVWRFREWVLPLDPVHVVTRGEGNTTLYDLPRLAAWAGLKHLCLKHEGENPTGSFKDRGMTVGVSMARRMGMQAVACASTGNTSASMASYAALAGMKAYVFIPAGNISFGKLSQALAYGARTIQIDGNFDDAMRLVEEVCRERGIYLVNSVNPYRIEGQKAIVIELLEDLDWVVPDWIVLPGGNLGNCSAISKGLLELHVLGAIDRLPRMAVIQAEGANPLYRTFTQGLDYVPVTAPETVATAIRIGDPVSLTKALRGLYALDGVVEQVTDQEILDAKAQVDGAGVGAEPASCATVAGVKKLVAAGVIQPEDRVAGILTGHILKDPGAVVGYHRGELEGIEGTYANAPVSVSAELGAVLEVLDG